MSTPTREKVLQEFGWCGWCEGGVCMSTDPHQHGVHNKMADEIVRLRTLADDDAAVVKAAELYVETIRKEPTTLVDIFRSLLAIQVTVDALRAARGEGA